MRFKTDLKNIRTFSKLAASLSSVEKITWARLDDDTARFTVIPDQGSQVWASLSVDLIFDNYHIQSAEPNNTINLELPLQPLQRALRSAQNSASASLRLTKKDGMPVLCMTITTTTHAGSGKGAAASAAAASTGGGGGRQRGRLADNGNGPFEDDLDGFETRLRRECEKVVTQDIPVRVLHPESLTFMQPRVRDADVHIQLPPLPQLKTISDRFTRLSTSSSSSSLSSSAAAAAAAASTFGSGFHSSTLPTSTATGSGSGSPRLELAATMHGSLRLRIFTDAGTLSSTWNGLENPQLDPAQVAGGDVNQHPSMKFRDMGPDRWATVRVDGRDWSKVLSVGRLEGRVIACFADEHALILYVYVPHYDNAAEDESVITYYVQSYSA